MLLSTVRQSRPRSSSLSCSVMVSPFCRHTAAFLLSGLSTEARSGGPGSLLFSKGCIHSNSDDLPVNRSFVFSGHIPAAGIHDETGAAFRLHNTAAIFHRGNVRKWTQFCHVYHLISLYAHRRLSYAPSPSGAVTARRLPGKELVDGAAQRRRQGGKPCRSRVILSGLPTGNCGNADAQPVGQLRLVHPRRLPVLANLQLHHSFYALNDFKSAILEYLD